MKNKYYFNVPFKITINSAFDVDNYININVLIRMVKLIVRVDRCCVEK